MKYKGHELDKWADKLDPQGNFLGVYTKCNKCGAIFYKDEEPVWSAFNNLHLNYDCKDMSCNEILLYMVL
jgi:uncharacterized OB-fold protein